MTLSKIIQQAVDKQLDRQKRQLDYVPGLKTVKIVVRLDKRGGL